MNRAYSTLVLKAVDEDAREITGIASTPSTDRDGDVILPKGAVFTLPIPLLWQHDARQPIGEVYAAKVTAAGIEVKARLVKVDAPTQLAARLEEAWQSIKTGLVRGLSIGFSAKKYSYLDGGGIEFSEWNWHELSAVTIPANQDATIQSIKSFDSGAPAATGHALPRVVTLSPPAGDSAVKTKSMTPSEGTKMTYAEQIKQFQATRAVKAARMGEIMGKAADEGRTLDATESEEFETLEQEIAATDSHVGRLEKMSKAQPVTAVDPTPSAAKASDSRAGVTVVKTSNLPKGTAFTRFVIAQCRAKGNLVQAVEIAKQWQESTPEVVEVLKAAMAAGTTTDSDWAAPLVPYQNMSSEFIELLRPQTIVGRMTGLRQVPFNVRIPGQTQGSSVNWVGEAAPKPVSELKFEDITLRFNKLAGIVVISDELARLSTPSAEGIIQGDLISQIAQFMDVSFIDPASAAVTDVRPASVTNGVTAVPSSGTDADALRTDVRALFSAFIAANLSVADAVWVTTPTLAMAIGMLQNPLGQPEFPGLGATGGSLMGLPVIVSESVPTDSSGTLLVLAKQSEILIADEGGVTIDVSREASLQMNSTPDNPASATTVLTSLWQNNLVGIRAERMVTWRKRRPQAVGYISGAAYGA